MLNEILTSESKEISYVEITILNIDPAPNESIRSWALGALKMKRKFNKHPQNDIRGFSMGKTNSV